MSKIITFIFLAICWCSFAVPSESLTEIDDYVSHQKRLSDDLLTKYGSTALRPVKNVSQPVAVSFRILVRQVIDFNEKEQQITINGWRKMTWKDEFMTWNTSDYGDVDLLEVFPSHIWLPDIKLYEKITPTASSSSLVNSIDRDFQSEDIVNVVASPDGSVLWFSPLVISSSCRIDVRFFPFDIQSCKMTFASWAYDTGSLDLNYSDDATSDIFLNNGVWDLHRIDVERHLDTYSCCPFPYSSVVLTLYLERRYEFYVFNMMVPCVMLSAMNALVFLVPPESGEKISFSVANLLASILFQQLIGELMPPLGDEIPLLGLFFLYMVGMSCFALGGSVMILRMFHRQGDVPLPRWVKRLFVGRANSSSVSYRRANVALRHYSQKAQHANDAGEKSYASKTNTHDANTEALQQLQAPNEKNSNSIIFAEFDDDYEGDPSLLRQELVREEWKIVARKVDKGLGAFVALSTLFVLLIILILFTQGDKFNS